MKLSRARNGEKFVFADRGGLWMNMGRGNAQMVFPRKDRKCSDLSPDVEVYVIFERDAKMPAKEPAKEPAREPVKINGSKDGMSVVLVDRETEQKVLVIENATAQQVAAYSYSEEVALTPKGKRKKREYDVDEVIMDHDNQMLLLVVRDVTDKGDGSNVVDV